MKPMCKCFVFELSSFQSRTYFAWNFCSCYRWLRDEQYIGYIKATHVVAHTLRPQPASGRAPPAAVARNRRSVTLQGSKKTGEMSHIRAARHATPCYVIHSLSFMNHWCIDSIYFRRPLPAKLWWPGRSWLMMIWTVCCSFRSHEVATVCCMQSAPGTVPGTRVLQTFVHISAEYWPLFKVLSPRHILAVNRGSLKLNAMEFKIVVNL